MHAYIHTMIYVKMYNIYDIYLHTHSYTLIDILTHSYGFTHTYSRSYKVIDTHIQRYTYFPTIPILSWQSCKPHCKPCTEVPFNEAFPGVPRGRIKLPDFGDVQTLITMLYSLMIHIDLHLSLLQVAVSCCTEIIAMWQWSMMGCKHSFYSPRVENSSRHQHIPMQLPFSNLH